MSYRAFLCGATISTILIAVACLTHHVTGSVVNVEPNHTRVHPIIAENKMSEHDNQLTNSDENGLEKQVQMSPDVMSARSYSYGNGGGGSGGSGSYNSGTMMYYSNFDTALTTLAFLSFGVFLLNMIFSFLDFGTPLGPITRDDVAGKDVVDGIMKLERRSTGSGAAPTMTPAALLALSAIQQTLLDNTYDHVNNYGHDEVDTDRPECAFRLFCDASQQPELRQRLDSMFSALTSFILTGSLRTNKKLWENAKLHQLLAAMENGGCAELLRMCPPNKTKM